VYRCNVPDTVVATGRDILRPTRRDGAVVQLLRRGDVRVVGDGVAVEGLAVRVAGAAEGAFEGSGVDFCVPSVFLRLVGDLYRLGGRLTLGRMVGGRFCHSSVRCLESEGAILELERSRREGHMSRLASTRMRAWLDCL
jgi:hypothetical protein